MARPLSLAEYLGWAGESWSTWSRLLIKQPTEGLAGIILPSGIIATVKWLTNVHPREIQAFPTRKNKSLDLFSFGGFKGNNARFRQAQK